jgi:hypothetical protein
MNAMPEQRPRSRKTELAMAMANGTPVTAWARGNQVPKRTACRWAGEAKVRAAVES